jgi:hypothetical protein
MGSAEAGLPAVPTPNYIRNRISNAGAGKVGRERTRALCADAAKKAGASPVEWKTLRRIVMIDEARPQLRQLHWLRVDAHINKTGFSRMRVGLATAVVCIDLAKMLHFFRTRGYV